jgi:hypothetical protein
MKWMPWTARACALEEEVAAVAAVTLTGCAGSPVRLANSYAQRLFEQDVAECEYQAHVNTNKQRTFGVADAIGVGIGEAIRKRELLTRCLKAKGWRQAQEGRLVTGASQLPCFTSLSRSLRRDDSGRGFAAPAVPGASFWRGSVFGRGGQRGQVSLNTVSHFQQQLGEVTCLFRGEADARLLHDRVAVRGAFLDLSQHAAGVRGLVQAAADAVVGRPRLRFAGESSLPPFEVNRRGRRRRQRGEKPTSAKPARRASAAWSMSRASVSSMASCRTSRHPMRLTSCASAKHWLSVASNCTGIGWISGVVMILVEVFTRIASSRTDLPHIAPKKYPENVFSNWYKTRWRTGAYKTLERL